MKYLYISIFIFLITGCKNQIEKDRKRIALTIDSLKLKVNTEASIIDRKHEDNRGKDDTLSINQVLFNTGKMEFKYEKLRKKKKDSLVFSEWACGSPFEWASDSLDGFEYFNYYSYYSNNLEYITNKVDVILFSGGFKDNVLAIKNRKIKLTEYTTLKDFQNIFPKSYDNYINTKNKYPQDYKDKDFIHISFIQDFPEDHWIFYFNKKGFLIRFELYWWLC